MALTKVDQTMVSDQVFGRRNVVINGAMQVAQRGTQTGLGASSGVYGATDRFSLVTNGVGGRMTIEQSTDTPSGFGNSVKLSCTTTDTSLAAGDYLSFSTRLEGRDMQRFKKGTSDAEKYAVSFYVKGNASATYVCELYDYDNFRHVNQTFSVTTAWTRVELSFPADTTGTLDNDSNLSFAINIYLHAGSNFTGGTLQSTWGTGYRATGTDNFFDSTDRTLFLTGVQLEVGDNPTPFEHLTYQETALLCYRYYYQMADQSSPMYGTTYNGNSADRGFVFWSTPVPMNHTPSTTQTVAGGSLSSTYHTVERLSFYLILDNGNASAGSVDYFTAEAEIQMEEIMNITSAKYIADEIKGSGHSNIKATIDNVEMFVPLDPNNRHYKAILAWVAAGNTIEAAD